MSDLNISSYLSSLSGTSSTSSGTDSTVSMLFSSINTNKSNTSSSDILGINLMDYSAIKSGSYSKVMKNYYSTSSDSSVNKEKIEAFKKDQEVTGDKAASVCSDLNDLMDAKYTEENRDNITEKLKSFVSDYNSLVKNTNDTDSIPVAQKAEWMTNMVKKYSNELSNLGITVNSDNTLSIEEDTLKAANMTSLKDAFGSDVGSIASKLLYKSEQIYSLAKTYGTSADSYTSSGAYNRDYSSNYDTNI